MSEQSYLNLLQEIMDHGVDKGDRTGTGMREIFGAQLRFRDIGKNFPLITTKKMFLKGITHELIWLLKADTNIKYLTDNGVKIWNEWADENGNLGKIYGHQWRRWEKNPKVTTYEGQVSAIKYQEPIDQISNVIKEIKNNPNSRRLLVSAWNVGDLDEMALPPCHFAFQFNVHPYSIVERTKIYAERWRPFNKDVDMSNYTEASCHEAYDELKIPKGKLHCHLSQRSGDCFLGIPFNISSYSLLTMMIAQVCDLDAGDFIHSIGSAHIYHNHFDQVKEQLYRTPMTAPQMKLNSEIKDIDSFKYEDFTLENYECHPSIKAPIAV